MMPGYINVKIETSSDDSDENFFDEFSYWLHQIGPWKHKHKKKINVVIFPGLVLEI